MKARLSRAVALAVAVAITLSLPTASVAQSGRGTGGARDTRLADAEAQRLADILHAQELYEEVLRTGVAGSKSGPYMAPLPGTASPSYLWGGLDVIEVIRSHDKSIVKDFGGTVFISRNGGDLGEPSISLPVETFPRSRDHRLALFKTEDNRALFEQMTKEGSLVIMFGLNCGWGIISGPVTNKPEGSHWAQPGLAAINVERFVDGKRTVTVLSVNLYSRGDDWNAIENPWQFAIQAFEDVRATPREWGRERPEMSVLKVNNF